MNPYTKFLTEAVMLALLLGNATAYGADCETAPRTRLESASDLSNRDLLVALTDPTTPNISREDAVAELVRRRAVQDLLNAFSHPADDVQQWWVARVLREIGGPDIARRMKGFASSKTTLTAYLSLYHLANEGDRASLATLNRNYFKYPVSSLEWAEAVRLFGTHHYKAAAPNLVGSLHAASFNLVEAAEESLGEMFPEEKREFDSLEETQRYWSQVVERKGRTDAAK